MIFHSLTRFWVSFADYCHLGGGHPQAGGPGGQRSAAIARSAALDVITPPPHPPHLPPTPASEKWCACGPLEADDAAAAGCRWPPRRWTDSCVNPCICFVLDFVEKQSNNASTLRVARPPPPPLSVLLFSLAFTQLWPIGRVAG